MIRRLKILTWNTHSSYLHYLIQAPHDFYLLSMPERPPGYSGRSPSIQWGDNVFDMPIGMVQHYEFDCILFQEDQHYLEDQYLYLSPSQRRLPRIYLEHDVPHEHPTDMRHPMDDADVLLVHVTPFNALMWDSGKIPMRVIEYGVVVPENVAYIGNIAKGLTLIDHLGIGERRLGRDIFSAIREQIPLDLAGASAEDPGNGDEGLLQQRIASFASYRFFFNPIRYGNLNLAVIEAMMIGQPIIGLATCELATVIDNGVSGYIDTDINKLAAHMCVLLGDPDYARLLGEGARRRAMQRFNIHRFIADWNAAFSQVTGFPLSTAQLVKPIPLGLLQRSPD
jgi:hypothetical protein